VKPALVGLTRKELEALFPDDRYPSIRARQLATWIYQKCAQSFAEMSDLPLKYRQKLEAEYTISPLSLLQEQISPDGVRKLLVHAGDNQGFECVLLPYKSRVSCCLSTQVGCPMGCVFCATGLSGFDRNLSAGEIVGQYLLLQSLSPKRISHVVFMGMGEPLHNYENTLRAIRLLHDEVGISYRRMTLSTVGLVPQIQRLAQEGIPLHLAISLHSPFDEIRDRLIPANRKWKVKEVVESARAYGKATGRKVTFEYLLIEEVTDTLEQARALAELVRGFPCIVNLIPFNYVETPLSFRRPPARRIRAFREVLESSGITVTQRQERGHGISAACGQLKGQHEGRLARRKNFQNPIALRP
jgi:23S rRNA (adenine2503-C2)-methyltransferase